jgi:SAM-dependent MidA family methyltransferase
LLDALPVHRLLRRGDEVLEIWVVAKGEELQETLRPPMDPDVARAGRKLLQGEGFQVEVRPGIGPWLTSASGCLQRGVVLSIDYGAEASRLFGPRRPDGTCVGYRDHRQTADLLAAPGEQDLTAQVDFTEVRRVGESLGLHSAPLLKQREFLFATGLLQELEEVEQSDRTEVEKFELRQAVAPLLMPGAGMGDAFKVLVQTKGVDLGTLPLSPEQGLQTTEG